MNFWAFMSEKWWVIIIVIIICGTIGQIFQTNVSISQIFWEVLL